MKLFIVLIAACLLASFAPAQQSTTNSTTTTAQEPKQESGNAAEKTGSALGTATRKTKNALKTAGTKTAAGVSTAASATKGAVQNSPQTASDVKKGAKQGYEGKRKPVTIVGCLDQDDKGNLLVRSAKYRDGVMVSTNEDLKAHVGHKVRITGTWADGGNKAVDAEKLEHMAATCEVPKE